jgi:hypothetical protein
VAERPAISLQATRCQGTRYQGSGGLEGPVALAERPKPVCLGRVFTATLVALGNVDLGAGTLPTYQTNWHAIVAHDAVRIRGVSQAPVTGTPAVGQYRDWPALGCFRLGSTLDGTVAADMQDDTVGGYANASPTCFAGWC